MQSVVFKFRCRKIGVSSFCMQETSHTRRGFKGEREMKSIPTEFKRTNRSFDPCFKMGRVQANYSLNTFVLE